MLISLSPAILSPPLPSLPHSFSPSSLSLSLSLSLSPLPPHFFHPSLLLSLPSHLFSSTLSLLLLLQVKLYNEKRSDLEEQQLHLNVGLQKIRETVDQVGELQSSLSIKKNDLEKKNALANQKLKQMVCKSIKCLLTYPYYYTVCVCVLADICRKY